MSDIMNQGFDNKCSVNGCKNETNNDIFTYISNYYRCKSTKIYFCSNECMNIFNNISQCQSCGYSEDLVIGTNGLAYCTSDEFWIESCYDKHMGIKNLDKRFMNDFENLMLKYDDIEKHKLESVKIMIIQSINEKIDEK